MNEWRPSQEFEDNVRLSFRVPSIRREFKQQVFNELINQAEKKINKERGMWKQRSAWVVVTAVLMILITAALVIGPQQVYASMLRLFGYIPGIGIVDTRNTLRILAEPVSVTRDGVTVSINQAVLTDTETNILYGISGVPLSSYPQGEAVSGCVERAYLRLPDGRRIEVDSPVPSQINDLTFILPCIFNTLPGSAPEQWEIALRFIPAPPDYPILPVVEITKDATPTQVIGSTEIAGTPVTPQPSASISVEKMIETEDGYILLGYIHPHLPAGNWLQITGIAVIRDADGKKVGYTFPMDVQPLDTSNMVQGGVAWAVQFKGAGVRFPISISFNGIVLSPVDPQATVKTTLDVGDNPQPGQVWEVNRNLQLAGRTFSLVSVAAESNGYTFQIIPEMGLAEVSVALEGYQAIGGGGGGQHTSLTYETLPDGVLSIVFSNPIAAAPTQIWQAFWQPDQVREFTAATSSGVCLTADSIQTVAALPAGLNGTVILTQTNPQLQIISSQLNGSAQQMLAMDAASAAVNQEGTRLAYSTDTGIVIQNLNDGTASTITGTYGRAVHWSPDGHFLATVNAGNDYGIFLVNLASNTRTQLSNLGYEAIAGWSADGATLYYAIPGSGDTGFLLRAVDIATRQTHDVFVLENSSRKAPMPALSPDGKWIAYRAFDNSSLHMKAMDGSPARLVLDNPAQAINGIAWEAEGHLLAVSLLTEEVPDGEIFLIAPDSCATYRLPGLTGQVDGIILPFGEIYP